MNYREVCEYLDNTLIFGIKPNLLRINKILNLLDNPHKKVNFIHVVGTNGKTSTTKITAAILNGHGFNAGYYVSPHIYSYTERISIRGSKISENNFVKTFKEIFPLVKEVNKMDADGEMTQFEILTAMMFIASFNEKLDVMVLEAGMGGRWDATNAASSRVVGLTGISLEHTQILGSTISAIAKEKAQVIKNNCLAATATADKTVLKILEDKVKNTGSKLFVIKKDFDITNINDKGIEGFQADINGIFNIYRNIYFPLPGNYQQTNLCLAAILSELFANTFGKKLCSKKINDSLCYTNITGRFQIMRRDPVFIADASHNPEGIKNLIINLKKYFKNAGKIIIFSVLKDKNYNEMISYILPESDIIILTSSCTERSLSADELEEEVLRQSETLKKDGLKSAQLIYKINSIENSIKYSLKIASKNDIICLTGSITNLEFVKSEYF
ncbi:MAG: Mur ligase family protein [Actinobacteria bacterium]|nr:Mur ligase family protein [Actinomycetota bacterium]